MDLDQKTNVTTLDTILGSHTSDIDLVHIKVNGAEQLVLEGSVISLQAHRIRCLLVENSKKECKLQGTAQQIVFSNIFWLFIFKKYESA